MNSTGNMENRDPSEINRLAKGDPTQPTASGVRDPQTVGQRHNSDDRIGQPLAEQFPGELSRRRFLSRLSATLIGVTGVVVVAPVVAYIVAPLFQESPDVWRDVGPVDNFQVGTTQEVTFEDATSLPWAGVSANTAAWLRRVDQNNFTAFAVNCTHLGCPVSWKPDAHLFLCPCHGGVYYADGRVAGGPPPHSLYTYETRVVQGRVQIHASGIPITS